MADSLIGLSYAHYPEAAGAQYRGFSEHPESIVWTMLIKNVLESRRHRVVLAPVGRLPNKVYWLNRQNPDIAIEVHFNGSADLEVNGCETLYCPGSVKGRLLATAIHTSYRDYMGNRDRGIKEGWFKMDKPGVEDYPGDVDGDESVLYFLRKTNCPAIIIEPEFIAQINAITTKRFIACERIAEGIISYLEANNG